VRKLLLLLTLSAATLAHAQLQTLPLWPAGVPDSQIPGQIAGPEKDATLPSDNLVGGKSLAHLTNVSNPNLAVYTPTAVPNTGAAVVVFPGGGRDLPSEFELSPEWVPAFARKTRG